MQEKIQQAIQHRSAQEYDAALAILTELLAAHPDDPQVNYQMAWLYDSMGSESAAVPYYERAIAHPLPDEDMRGALLGLGSTYRCLGEYHKAAEVLRRGMVQFPDSGEFQVFLAMTLYNLGQHSEAMALLLRVTATTSQDAGIQRYQRAILFYHDKLDQTWTS